MSITQRNTYVVGSNNDLSNALLNIDLNRIGGDLTYLENDGGTLKVSVGSLIEANGSIYAVSGSAETPSGTAENGAYLFFDPAGPSFVWSSTPGIYDPVLGGIYDASDRRQCRFRLKTTETWDVLLVPESPDARIDGDLEVEGSLQVNGELDVSTIIGDPDFDGGFTVNAGSLTAESDGSMVFNSFLEVDQTSGLLDSSFIRMGGGTSGMLMWLSVDSGSTQNRVYDAMRQFGSVSGEYWSCLGRVGTDVCTHVEGTGASQFTFYDSGGSSLLVVTEGSSSTIAVSVRVLIVGNT